MTVLLSISSTVIKLGSIKPSHKIPCNHLSIGWNWHKRYATARNVWIAKFPTTSANIVNKELKAVLSRFKIAAIIEMEADDTLLKTFRFRYWLRTTIDPHNKYVYIFTRCCVHNVKENTETQEAEKKTLLFLKSDWYKSNWYDLPVNRNIICKRNPKKKNRNF